MPLEQLVIKPATPAQAHEAVRRNASHWGARVGITVDGYVKLFAIFQQEAFARDGRLKTWVLSPKDDPDTTSFYASCQILTRELLILQPGQSSPTSSFGHAISSVFVPPEHRGKGYANQFMSLMHSVLAPHRYPDPLKAPTVTDHPSSISVLYSAVGDYYARCIPSEGESGWTLQKSLVTTWPLSNVEVPSSKGSSAPIELLSESDVTSTLDSDDSLIPADLLELQKKDPTKTYFTFVPTAPLNAYSIIISKLSPGALSNPPWGAKISGTSDFMTWAYIRHPGLKLAITRLRASQDSFPVLLNAALQVARDMKCESIEAWNVPEHLAEIARAAGGETAEREVNRSAFKWYGHESSLKVENADVIWALDERYSWC
ncbi:hypothetical protein V565_152400 [Rhizoctonia solani 123E]|uniref:LYC1 C-terminal domain-containing protein n=1 Tax=Rhizoctonia solani 123E TaxID=1423351 RepID=A0A074SBX9_9AGAM|nr:hypothetical protein V565_152400 [Rhizoctonia solani 123E]